MIDRDKVVCGVVVAFASVDCDRVVGDSALNVETVARLTAMHTNNHNSSLQSMCLAPFVVVR